MNNKIKYTGKTIITLFTAVLFGLVAMFFTGCSNRQFFDTTYKFDKAIISLPNGEIVSGTVDSWRDFEDGDQLQIKINGTTYLVHSSDAVLIAE